MTDATHAMPATAGWMDRFKTNLGLRAFGFFKVPMIFWSGASVTELTDQRCVVTIPLKRRNRNHLKSMYFGALAVGEHVA